MNLLLRRIIKIYNTFRLNFIIFQSKLADHIMFLVIEFVHLFSIDFGVHCWVSVYFIVLNFIDINGPFNIITFSRLSIFFNLQVHLLLYELIQSFNSCPLEPWFPIINSHFLYDSQWFENIWVLAKLFQWLDKSPI